MKLVVGRPAVVELLEKSFIIQIILGRNLYEFKGARVQQQWKVLPHTVAIRRNQSLSKSLHFIHDKLIL